MTNKTEFEEAIAAGNSVLIDEQARLLRKCRAAINHLVHKKGMAGVMFENGYEKNSVGNLHAELFEYRPSGVFGGNNDKQN